MLGVKFIKVQPTTYVLEYRGGRVRREGTGLSFFYYSPTTSLVAVPVASTDVPFIFEETTADFQTVTMQGQVTYRVDKAGIIHCIIGKSKFEAAQLKDNLLALINDLNKAKPATSKGVYLKKITLSSTMGPGVVIDQASLGL